MSSHAQVVVGGLQPATTTSIAGSRLSIIFLRRAEWREERGQPRVDRELLSLTLTDSWLAMLDEESQICSGAEAEVCVEKCCPPGQAFNNTFYCSPREDLFLHY